jgi:hypothetical protein
LLRFTFDPQNHVEFQRPARHFIPEDNICQNIVSLHATSNSILLMAVLIDFRHKLSIDIKEQERVTITFPAFINPFVRQAKSAGCRKQGEIHL